MIKKTGFLWLLLLGVLAVSAQSLQPSPQNSKIEFSIKNMGITVNGSLSDLKGKMAFDPQQLKSSSFDVTVGVNTINTGNQKRDAHLKKPDFFDAAKYPTIGIKTTSISAKGNNTYLATARLTMHGVTKAIQFEFTAQSQNGGYRFKTKFTIDRKDFGVGGNSMTMGDDVQVSLDVIGNK
ncbi:YceI family protein [Niabella terrae]